jgi:ribonuclease Z
MAQPLDHSVETLGYRITQPPQSTESGSPFVFTYIADTRPNDACLQLSRVADLLLCQATFLEAQKIQAYQRLLMTATEAATLAANASAKRLLLTHFSHRYDEINAFLHEARPIFSAVDTARDCARYAVSHHALISTPAT